MLGLGVIIQMLGGNAGSANAFRGALNKKITALSLDTNDTLHFVFEDGYKIRIFDDGQSCCEDRYMRTDDDLDYYIGSILLGAEVRDAPNVAEDDGHTVHEVQFLVVETDKGSFTMSSHNEHNGYYGGFSIRVVCD